MRTCPLPQITQESRYWLRLHLHYTNNKLWADGGIRDQPAPYSQAMEIIENAR